MTAPQSPQDHYLLLLVNLHESHLRIQYAGQPIPLTEKWAVYYALLALHQGKSLTPDDLHDYHPWSTLKPSGIGPTLWRFTETQEPLLFGTRLTSSPTRARTKQFQLAGHLQVTFWPNRETIAEHLSALRAQPQSHALALSQLTLRIASGHLQPTLAQLQGLQKKPLTPNEQAQIQALITTCLDRLHGVTATAQQVPHLEKLLRRPDLSRLTRAQLLVRLARHHTLSGHYPQAQTHYAQLAKLLAPPDGVEYAQYHLNYGLYLRRQHDLTGARTHTLTAHDTAHRLQWWYGVQAAQSNLALIYISMADQHRGRARQDHFQKAKEWAMQGHETITNTLLGEDEADLSLLLCVITRELEQYDESREWAAQAIAHAARIPNQEDLKRAYTALAQLEDKLGNHEAATEARRQAEQTTIHP